MKCDCGKIVSFPSEHIQGRCRCPNCARDLTCPPTDVPLLTPSNHADHVSEAAVEAFSHAHDAPVGLIREEYCPTCLATFVGTTDVCPTCHNKVPDPVRVSYASPIKRISAGLLDLAILSLFLVVVRFYLFWAFFKNDWSPQLLILTALGIFITGFFYSIGCHTLWGKTPGKMALRIKVVRSNFAPLTLNDSVSRFFASLLPIVTAGITFAIARYDSRGRSLHDRLSDTVVIDENP